MNIQEIFKVRKRAGEVGIEIECEGQNLMMPDLYWDAVHDGSLRGLSIEYVLKNPAKRKEISKVLNYLYKSWKDHGAVINDSPRTSVHIHVNVQELEVRNVIAFYCLYNILEELLVKFCGKGREGNLFCLTSTDANFALDLLCNIVARQEWYKFKDRNFRYSAVNFNSIPKFGSLEFRTMRGTRDIALIKRWINMLLKIKDYSLQFKQPANIIEHLSARGGRQFVNDVMEEYAVSLLAYPDINNIIRQGVWRIQELAFIPITDKKPRQVIKAERAWAEEGPMMAGGDLDIDHEFRMMEAGRPIPPLRGAQR